MPESEVDRSLRELESTLRRLDSLRADGLLTDAEYEAARQRALDAADLGTEERNEEPLREEATATPPDEYAQEELAREEAPPQIGPGRDYLISSLWDLRGSFWYLRNGLWDLLSGIWYLLSALAYLLKALWDRLRAGRQTSVPESSPGDAPNPAFRYLGRSARRLRRGAWYLLNSLWRLLGGLWYLLNSLWYLLQDLWDRLRVSPRRVKFGLAVFAFAIVIGIFGALTELGVFGEVGDEGSVRPAATSSPTAEPTPRPTAPPTQTPPTEPPGLGTFEVGNLRLTVLEVDTYDAPGEDSNYRVRLRLRKLGGSTYDFTDSVFQIIDENGHEHDHDTSCNGFPGNIIPNGNGLVIRGESPVERWVYFEITREISPSEFRFESSSVSAPSDSIRIPSTPRPVVRESREQPKLFSLVQVGSLELTVLQVDTYDAAGEDSNYRVRIRIRKTKGDTYEFTNSVFQIIDSSGYTHNHDTSCRDCPGNIIPNGYGFILRGSQPVEKWVYFEITREITPSEFRFEASSISAPSVLIKIPPEPRPVVRATRETPEPTKVPAPTTRPSPRSTQEPEECPSTLEGLWASEVAAAMESTLDPADELSDLFGLAGENSSLLISAEWRALVAVNLALLDLAADEMLAVTAPSNRTRSIQNTVDTIAREIKAGVSNITIGLDSFDAATLERGSSSINRAGQLMTQVTTQVDRLCL